MGDINVYYKNKQARKEQAEKHTFEMVKNYSGLIMTCAIYSQIYSVNFNPKILYKGPDGNNTEFTLVDKDSVASIIERPLNEKVAVLNFASYKNPGGKFIEGSSAQEESLCHASFLYNVLVSCSAYYEWNNEHKNRGLYENRAIYSPDVLFQKGQDKRDCDVITCAAPNIIPSRKYNWGVSDEENTKALKSRIKFVLDIAADQKVETLILGAFGCGVFGQDAEEVANIFMDYLTTTHKMFKKVIFAIPTDFHTENYDKFEKVFKERGLL